jgi:hypothetical protein
MTEIQNNNQVYVFDFVLVVWSLFVIWCLEFVILNIKLYGTITQKKVVGNAAG